jgi:hypothetical protein
MWASGRVVITRPDMDARSDSAQLLLNDSVGYLIGQPIIVGRDTSKMRVHTLDTVGMRIDTSGADSSIQYRLTGQRIRFNLGEHQQVRRVLSSGDADARGPAWHLSADTLDMAVYSGLSTIVADSLDIQMPGQVMKQVWAYGHSRAASKGDSTWAEEDWLSGDSLIATFAPVADTAGADRKKSQIDHVIAFGTARALYHTANQRDSTGPLGVNYSRGDKINIAMREGKVHTVDIVGKVDGVYLEPIPPHVDTATVDSLGNPIARDSLGRRIVSDTGAVPSARPQSPAPGSRPPQNPVPAAPPPATRPAAALPGRRS